MVVGKVLIANVQKCTLGIEFQCVRDEHVWKRSGMGVGVGGGGVAGPRAKVIRASQGNLCL